MTKQTIKYILAALFPVVFATAAQAQLQVFKTQENIKVAGKLTDVDVDGATIYEKETIYQYYDGFNRPVETVIGNGTPLQKDFIQPVAYDAFGSVSTGLLPYTDGYTSGFFRGGAATTAQATFYNNTSTYLVARDNSPYSTTVFENSPLRRVLQSGMVGDGFQPGVAGAHFKSVNYRGNNTTADGGIFIWFPNGTYVPGTLYGPNSLTVTEGIDEDGVTTRVYTDETGRTVLKRQVHTGGNLDTYYVYNMAGMLTYVIPPAAVAQLAAHSYSLTASPINKMIFSYTYDSKGRLATKTVPSAGAVYYVYDYWNRPVLIQDGNLRTNNKWNYIKYDIKGRVISQGTYTDAVNTTQSGMQGVADAATTNWYEGRSSTLTNGGYYTNNCFPNSSISALAYAYYDNYDIDNNGTDNFSYATQSDATLGTDPVVTGSPLRGVPTVVSKTTIGNGIASGTWFTTVTFFDKRGNPIQVQSNNQIAYTTPTAMTDFKTIIPDFTGVPQISKVSKTGAASAVTTVYTSLIYDHMYRIQKVRQKYGSGTMQDVASYQYNEIGQVIQKGLGYVNSTTWLQNLDMRYNIRGQLLTINNSTLTNDMTTKKTNGDTNDLFGMELLYDQADPTGVANTARFNGKLTGVKWMSKDGSGTATRERAYRYLYDDLDRYKASVYGERLTAGTGSFSQNAGAFSEYGITYDAGGNILHMDRNSGTVGGSTHTVIDSMSYLYDTTNLNQLKTVTELGTSAGFVGGTGNYVYDANSGNLTTDPYKGLTLTYNTLNRTDKIQTSTTNRYIDYTYDANGNLLRKRQYDNSGGVPVLQKTTDYVDGFLYENNTLVYFPMPEGRVLVSGGGTTFLQEFVIADQQGNARLSFQNNAGTAKAMQENSYYGFGMTMASAMGLPGTPNKQLYNGGSEWQNDYNNSPDYYQTFNRNYDAALGRFVAVDPMSEVSESVSIYHYAGNNPITYNDPMGNYQTNPFTPGFNQQVGNVWTDPNVNMGPTAGGLNPNLNYGGATGAGDNMFYYMLLNAASGGSAEAWKEYSALKGGTKIYQAYGNGKSTGVSKGSLRDYMEDIHINGVDPTGVTMLAEVTIKDAALKIQAEAYNTGFYQTGDPFSYAGDVHLSVTSRNLLPPQSTTNTQVGNLCVFKTMEWAARYKARDMNSGDPLLHYSRTSGKSPQTIEGNGPNSGVPAGDLSGLFANYFTGYFIDVNGYQGIRNAINHNNPVMAYLNEGLNNGHEVMITGYSTTSLFGVYYFDPQLGNYHQTSWNNFNLPFVVQGLKNH